jgi:2',3'-cyclic-nucleotide 2'-phosphodiesterase (5'-nucleotidase family)
MPLIIRVTSADNQKVFTRRLDANSARIEVPSDAKVAIVDEATGKVLPVRAQIIRTATGEDERILVVADHEGLEIMVTVIPVAAWPVDTVLAMNEGLDGGMDVASESDRGETGFARASEPLDFASSLAGGIGVLPLILGVVALGVGVALIADGDDEEDTPAPTPTPTPPPPDTTAPAAPTDLDLADDSDDGIADDNITSITEDLVITGTAEAGSTVELFAGETSLGTVQAGSDGAFSFTVDLPAGANSLTVTATDAAGNTSAASAALVVTVDAAAPAAPAGLALAAASDTGVPGDNLTAATNDVVITGTAEAGSTVELFNGETSLGTATAGADGTFSIPVDLVSGVTSITATATDSVGNTSAASAPFAVTVDTTAPAAPTALDLAIGDDGNPDDDIVSDGEGLVVTGMAEPGSAVELFVDGISVGTTTASGSGAFSAAIDLALGESDITATATDAAGNTSNVSNTLTITVNGAPELLNTSIDGLGDVVTLYFSRQVSGMVSADDFTVTQGAAATIDEITVTGNRVTLRLAEPLAETGAVIVSYDGTALADSDGLAAASFADVAITNRLATEASNAIAFGAKNTLQLDGAEIAAFDPQSDRFFVTSGDGLQVIAIDADLNMELLGTIEVGTNNITSVAVKNSLVAVAVAGERSTDAGRIFFLDADGAADETAILGDVEVGALPDMVTFTPDGTKVLVANEGERTPLDDIDEDNPLVDPEGSVSIIDISGGVESATVQTATFTGFNDQLAALVAEGVRTFAGLDGYEDLTLAQDLEPEFIAISPDGTQAFVTLQEANAIAILDIASATIIDIQPLGLKSYDGLPFDLSDRDGGINLRTDNPNVFGQFMPDAIASFVGGDGETYYVIANEGDDREDFFDPSPVDRAADLNLDPAAFPDAATLQENEELGRLTVTVQPGLNGDTDGDGDSDQILAYGGRSFSILNSAGEIVFDSGSQIEEFVAAGGLFDEDTNTGLFDDGRSDNKGAEPEGITTGVFGDNVLAFVGLERGGGGVMVYDVTDPRDVKFVSYVRDINDVAPEGLIYIPAEDSPSGKPLLVVTAEGSSTLSTFEISPPGTAYTLQLLHFADAEAKSLAIDTAPNLAALVDAFEDDYVNSITLSGGDNYIPGLFFDAQSADSILNQFGFSGGPRIDIAIHNAIGVQASTIGNHEFDRGTANFAFAISEDGDYAGALFPYLSANLDFSGDANLAPLFMETLGAGLDNAADLAGMLVPSAVIEENGELIGIVGATTQVLDTLTSVGGTAVKGAPGANDMPQLALVLQPYIDDLIAQGVNKIIVMSHLQQIALEEALAPLLEGVDIILAAGSNTRLADEDDELSTFGGAREAVAQGPYPIVTSGLDGAPTLIVNTDSEYTYLGRLVVDFDENGEIILDNLDPSVNGAYAATAEQVAQVYGVEATDNFTVSTVNGTLSTEAALAAVAGNAYVNFHSGTNPSGEVRGQLVLTQDNRDGEGNGTLVFEVELTGAAEVPPVSTDAFGSGRVIVLARDGEFTYNSEYTLYNFASTDLLDPASPGGHIHVGGPDENGPIVEDILADPGTTIEDFDFNLLDTALAEGTRGGVVKELVDAVDDVVATQLANVFGFSNVFLEGNRSPGVRTQETNLGNLTADANVAAARTALENEGEDATFVVAIKNGGGIRDSIGQDVVIGNEVTKGANDGGVITERDIGAVLAFNNGLVVFDVTPQELLNLLNSPNTFRLSNGGFLQTGGMQVSYEYDVEEGEAVTSATNFSVIDVAVFDDEGNKIALVDDGEVVDGAPGLIRVVGLDFTARNDGDGYEFAENGTNFRYIVEDMDGNLALSDPLAEVQQTGAPVGDLIVDTASFAGDPYGEQAALADFLIANFGTPEMAFNQEDTGQDLDQRIQNVDAREDTVLEGAMLPAMDMVMMIEMVAIEAFA